jgi:trimethylamine--corrinoid protein Co-methyltransferase
VGISGSLLEQPHTAEHFHDELFMPALLFRQTREEWERQGSKHLGEAAEEKAQQLMQNTVDHKLNADQLAELNAMTNRFVTRITEEQ